MLGSVGWTTMREMRQRAELRERQSNPRQSYFQALLDGAPGVNEGKHQLAVLLAVAAALDRSLFHI